MRAIFDTNLLLAVASSNDRNHQSAKAAMREFTGERVIVAPMLTELFYLLSRDVNYQTAIATFELLQSSAFYIEDLTKSDMQRMAQIMLAYRDSQFDFVDTAIMAVAERLLIDTIFTFDRRDFAQIRPLHCPSFSQLP
jgi:hypothetical protein